MGIGGTAMRGIPGEVVAEDADGEEGAFDAKAGCFEEGSDGETLDNQEAEQNRKAKTNRRVGQNFGGVNEEHSSHRHLVAQHR